MREKCPICRKYFDENTDCGCKSCIKEGSAGLAAACKYYTGPQIGLCSKPDNTCAQGGEKIVK